MTTNPLDYATFPPNVVQSATRLARLMRLNTFLLFFSAIGYFIIAGIFLPDFWGFFMTIGWLGVLSLLVGHIQLWAAYPYQLKWIKRAILLLSVRFTLETLAFCWVAILFLCDLVYTKSLFDFFKFNSSVVYFLIPAIPIGLLIWLTLLTIWLNRLQPCPLSSAPPV